MNLARTQMLALAAKAVTSVLGIVQSILIIRFLSKGEYGLVGLVMSVGGVIGVSQHLGIVDGAIREIAVLQDKAKIAKVFWVSHLVRQIITIPLSLGLLVLAQFIAGRIYGHVEIAPYLQIFAGILILQGLQDVLGATLTGLKQFKALYLTQIVTAAINIAVFGYLTWQYQITGFFVAVAITTLIMVGMLFGFVWRSLRGFLLDLSWTDITEYGRRVMRIGLFMYVARIFFVVWQRLPILVLGVVLSAEHLGELNVSLTFGSKLTIIAMALSEVNIAWMSSLFSSDRERFALVATKNMHRVLMVMTILTLVLLFFVPEILTYLVGAEYLPAAPIIMVMTLGFFLYSLMDIGTSSIFVSMDRPHWRAGLYGIMFATSGVITVGLLLWAPSPLLAAGAVLAGALVGYFGTLLIAWRRLKLALLNWKLGLLLLALVASVVWLTLEPLLWWRIIVFTILLVYITWEAHRSELLPTGILSLKDTFKKNEIPQSKIFIVCFAGAVYEQTSWTNRQQMMSRVSQLYPVLYIEPRLWLGWYVKQLLADKNPWRAAWKFARQLFGYNKKASHLFITSQWNLIPFSREYKLVANLNHYLNRYRVLRLVKKIGARTERVVIWIYDTEAAEYLSAFPKNFVLYDCVDDHAAQAGAERNRERVRQEEKEILNRADLVTVTSQRLYDLKQSANPTAQLVLNAGDVRLFSAPTTPSPVAVEYFSRISRPIFGLVGALDSYKIDIDLIEKVARLKPDWQFVLIGEPIIEKGHDQISKLKQQTNIHLLGPIKRTLVPGYVRGFDVCVIPYRHSQYNASSFPLKFWEFMATGKPVIVSGVPEVRRFEPLISFVDSAEEFIEVAHKWLTNPTELTAKRVALAQEHSWEKRVARVLALLERGIKDK